MPFLKNINQVASILIVRRTPKRRFQAYFSRKIKKSKIVSILSNKKQILLNKLNYLCTVI